jgi:hypothetical protein
MSSQPCRRCGTLNLVGAEFCVTDQCRAYLGWDPLPEATAPAPQQPSSAPTARPAKATPSLRVEIADLSLTVEPGESIATTLTVQHLGQRVEEVAIDVVGAVASFSTVDPPTLKIYPGTTTTCTLRVSPPRTSTCPAGHLGYAVRVRSRLHDRVAASAGANMTIGTYTDLTAELVPPAARKRLRSVHHLTLTNNGNGVQRVHVTAVDRAHGLRFDLPSSAIDLPPGRITVPVGVRARPALTGSGALQPFEVAVSSAEGATLVHTAATRTTPPWLPSWLFAALTVLALVGGVVGLSKLIPTPVSANTAQSGTAAGPPIGGGKAPAGGGVARGNLTAISRSGWTRPVPGPIVSGFRSTERPGHDGLDISAPKGTVIRAASAGVVVTVLCNVSGSSVAPNGTTLPCDFDGNPGLGGCGWYVQIRHADNIVSRYCHMVQQPAVQVGQTVVAGQPIGLVGSSGNSSGPHLHFEIHLGFPANEGNALEPKEFMAARGVAM